MAKRAFDLIVSLAGLIVLSPLLVVVALLVVLDSGRPVFFTQVRAGRHFHPFQLFKFRTMVTDAAAIGRPITVGDDPRITRVGHWLRRSKLDELPQLWNVVRGDMSLVGPRPELFVYVQMFQEDFDRILRARPGITDAASLHYRNESDALAQASDPEGEYTTRILPDKLRRSASYLERSTLRSDVALIFRTIFGRKL